jgi:rhodanese-related sulfurtransferase
MRLLLVFLLVVSGISALGQSKQFVCTPCGSDCDKEVYDHGGQCRSCGMALVEKSTATVTNLTIEEMCSRIASNPNVILMDVRSPGEFKGSSARDSYGHFKNAININIDDLEGRLDEISKYKNEEIIVYCSHSHRSPRAAYLLSINGFKDVKNMAGGVSTLSGRKDNECIVKDFVFH